MMEVRGTFEQVADGWLYRSAYNTGKGSTPENAYAAWLAGFDYRGEGTTINKTDSAINSPNT